MSDLRYIATFKDGRLGRSRDVAPLTVEGKTADDLAEVVYRFAKGRLISKMFEVVVDMSQLTGWIEGGRFATFTLSPAPGWCPDVCPLCGYRLKHDGFPLQHQSSVDGTICALTWEPKP